MLLPLLLNVEKPQVWEVDGSRLVGAWREGEATYLDSCRDVVAKDDVRLNGRRNTKAMMVAAREWRS